MLVLPVEMCQFCLGCYRGLVIKAVAYSDEEGRVPENLRMTCERLRLKVKRARGMRTFTPEEAIPRDLKGSCRLTRYTERSMAIVK